MANGLGLARRAAGGRRLAAATLAVASLGLAGCVYEDFAPDVGIALRVTESGSLEFYVCDPMEITQLRVSAGSGNGGSPTVWILRDDGAVHVNRGDILEIGSVPSMFDEVVRLVPVDVQAGDFVSIAVRRVDQPRGLGTMWQVISPSDEWQPSGTDRLSTEPCD